jgi:type I restriction enzyme S subunit
MSFPRYPKYKASGVEWLGDVPEHWEVKRLKHNLRLITRKTERRDHPVGLENIESWSGRFIFTQTIFEGEGISFEKGDILFGKLRPYLAKAYLAEFSGEAVGDFHVLRPKASACGRFAQYQILNREFIAIVDGSTFGAKMPRASWEFVGGMNVALPPLAEQTAIAEFLDRETAKIDGLVAEQRRLIALLKEKRQAVISHAVTKGLHPNAPTKPSGIPWLGDVPAHWEVRRVSQLFRAGKGKNGQMLTKEYCGANEGDYPVYSGQTENEGVMGTWNQFEFDFGNSGVLFSTTVGAKAMYLRHLFGKFSLSQNCMIIWPTSNRCLTRFFYYHFQPLFQWQRSMIPDHMQPSFRMEDLYGCMIAIPSQREQEDIVAHLDTELARFDALTAEAERAIDLLHERRTALISAAVTGQIDVRQHPAN